MGGAPGSACQPASFGFTERASLRKEGEDSGERHVVFSHAHTRIHTLIWLCSGVGECGSAGRYLPGLPEPLGSVPSTRYSRHSSTEVHRK